MNEVFAAEYMSPIRLLSPSQDKAGTKSIGVGPISDMQDWNRQIGAIVAKHRIDPGAIHTIGCPVEYQVLGPNGKDLIPGDLLLQAEDMRLNQVVAVVRERSRLVRVRLCAWSKDEEGFYCIVIVTISATETVSPQSSVNLSFSYNELPLTVRSFDILTTLETLDIDSAISEDSLNIQLNGITARFTGSKGVRVKVRFQNSFDIELFNASQMKVAAHGTV